MSYGYNLPTDIIIQPVHGVGVDETISHPDPGFHRLLNFTNSLDQKKEFIRSFKH